jgi:hypothetical protein
METQKILSSQSNHGQKEQGRSDYTNFKVGYKTIAIKTE